MNSFESLIFNKKNITVLTDLHGHISTTNLKCLDVYFVGVGVGILEGAVDAIVVLIVLELEVSINRNILFQQ